MNRTCVLIAALVIAWSWIVMHNKITSGEYDSPAYHRSE